MSKFRMPAWLFGGFFLLLIVGYLAARIWFDAYLHSDGFRRLIASKTSSALKAQGEFEPFQFAGATVYSDAFHARGAGAFFSELRADQIRAAFNLSGVWHHAWQIDNIDVQRMEMRMAGAEAQIENESWKMEKNAPSSSTWLPNRVEMRRAIVHETDLKWSDGAVTGATLTVMPADDAWTFAVEGGRVSQMGWPDLKIAHADLRYRRPSLFVTDAELKCGETGSVTASGEMDFGQTLDLQLKLNGVPIAPLLPPDWRARLKGNVSSDVKVRAPLPGNADSMRLDGSITLAQGELEALPILDQIAIFTRTQQFRMLTLTKASADFSHAGTRTSVTNFISESEGLIRIEGSFVIANGTIEGTFQVGVTPSSLQWLPGSQAKVFTVARGGYLWTPMRLSGPVNHPAEDLSPRLAAAAQGAVIEGVQGTIENTTKGVLDLVSPLLKAE